MMPKKITRLILEISGYSEYSAARQFLFAENFAGRGWQHGRTNLKVNWYPTERKYLGDQWSMNVVSLYAATGCVIRAFHTVGGQWLGSTRPRPTPTRHLSPQTPVHEDGGRDRDAPFSSWTYYSAYTTGVTEISVGHEPTGVDEAYLPVRASVTRRPADGYATPVTVVVVTATKVAVPMATDEGLDCLVRDVTKNAW